MTGQVLDPGDDQRCLAERYFAVLATLPDRDALTTELWGLLTNQLAFFATEHDYWTTNKVMELWTNGFDWPPIMFGWPNWFVETSWGEAVSDEQRWAVWAHGYVDSPFHRSPPDPELLSDHLQQRAQRATAQAGF